MILDTYKHKGLRRKLIDLLKSKGIRDTMVLQAMDKIPRHIFFTKEFEHYAYEDKAFPIESGQTISQPYTVAFQSALLQIKKGEKVLEVGTGSGYQCAVLCELGAVVFSIEIQSVLHKKAIKILNDLGYQANLILGDGSAGCTTAAPFDKIIVTAGATQIPQTLLAQLKVGGWMVIPVGSGEDLEMKVIRRVDETRFEQSVEGGIFRFVPFVNS